MACICQSNHRPYEEKDLTSGRITTLTLFLADVCVTCSKGLQIWRLHSSLFHWYIISIVILHPSMSTSAACDKIEVITSYPIKQLQCTSPFLFTVFFLCRWVFTSLLHSFFQFNNMNSFTIFPNYSQLIHKITIIFFYSHLDSVLNHVFKCNIET